MPFTQDCSSHRVRVHVSGNARWLESSGIQLEADLCKTSYTFLSIPLSSVGSSSIVHQNVARVFLLTVVTDKSVNALWLCKV